MVVLFDLPYEPPESHKYSDLFKEVEFESERAVFNCLARLGHEPFYVGVFGDLPRLIGDLKKIEPHLVFNLTESFNGRREGAPSVASVLDLLKIPYSGTGALGLGLSQDKNLAKKILVHHHIRVPKWVASTIARPLKKISDFEFPAFVKPAKEEASEGIARDSFVENEKDCLDRIQFLHEKFESDVIIEEYISGRELYASVLGNKRLQVFPLRELNFKEFPEDLPKFATYKTKWDVAYRKKYGIKNEFAKNLSEEQIDKIQSIAKRAFEGLQLKGFARFDLRLSEAGELVLLEANPNPSLSPWDDFSRSAQEAGLSYDDLIEKIIDLI